MRVFKKIALKFLKFYRKMERKYLFRLKLYIKSWFTFPAATIPPGLLITLLIVLLVILFFVFVMPPLFHGDALPHYHP